MNISIFTEERSQAFLQEVTEKIKLQGEYRKVFLERFSKNNRGETNTVLAEKMWPDHNYDQKFTVSLNKAIDQIKATYREINDLIISRVNSPPLGAYEKSKKELQYPAACGGVVYFPKNKKELEGGIKRASLIGNLFMIGYGIKNI